MLRDADVARMAGPERSEARPPAGTVRRTREAPEANKEGEDGHPREAKGAQGPIGAHRRGRIRTHVGKDLRGQRTGRDPDAPGPARHGVVSRRTGPDPVASAVTPARVRHDKSRAGGYGRERRGQRECNGDAPTVREGPGACERSTPARCVEAS